MKMEKSKFYQRLKEAQDASEKRREIPQEEKIHTISNWISGVITIGVGVGIVWTILHFIIKYW